MEVIGGCNLPMLIETSMASSNTETLEELVDLAVKSGKDNVVLFKTLENNDTDEYEE